MTDESHGTPESDAFGFSKASRRKPRSWRSKYCKANATFGALWSIDGWLW